MKMAVLYRSMTGHSKKIARAIALKLGVIAFDMKTKPEINNIDLLFIVGGIYSGKSLPDSTEYLQTLDSNKVKRAVLITSSATDKYGQDELRQILISKNIDVAIEEYRCRGSFLFLKLGHPNKQEITNAVIFAQKFLIEQ